MVSYDYFMYRMRDFEVDWLLDNVDLATKQDWEQTRYTNYVQMQMNSKKKLKLTDVLMFPWDKEEKEKEQNISSTDIERLRIKAKAIQKTFNK